MKETVTNLMYFSHIIRWSQNLYQN